MISVEDARWIASYYGPEQVARLAWVLASPYTSALVGLDMRTGATTALKWPAGEDPPAVELEDVLVLASCPASRRAELPGLLMAGSEGMLSEEDAEALALEVVVRAAMGDGGERFWKGVDEQLRERARR